jgi:hypothetical protein
MLAALKTNANMNNTRRFSFAPDFVFETSGETGLL